MHPSPNPETDSTAHCFAQAFIMKRCRDRNIVQFLGTAVDREQALLVTEFMEAGDLHSALRRDSTEALLWYRRRVCSCCHFGAASPPCSLLVPRVLQ